MKLNRTTLLLSLNVAGFAGVLGVAAACYGFVHGPMADESVKLRQRREMLKQLRDSRDTVLAKNQTIRDSIDRLRPSQRDLAARLPNGPRDDTLLGQVSQLAKESEIQLHDFQPGGQSRIGELHSSIVRVHLSGDYHKLCRFISGIEKMNRLTRIADVKVRLADPAKGILDINVRLLAFFQPHRDSGK